MQNEIDGITQQLDTRPDVPTELADRAGARARLAAYFRAHPGEDLEQSDLKRAAGCDAVTQRIRELVRDDRLDITSVPTFLTDAAGKKHRLLNRYRFTPHTPLGRDSTQPAADRWPTGGPWTEPFELKP